MKNLRPLLLLFLILLPVNLLFSADAKQTVDKILQKEEGPESVSRVITELSGAVSSAESLSDKRSLLVTLAWIEENAGRFSEASRSYALAAGIAAPPARDMPKVSAEQLVIDAVRCALSAGDWTTAETYLDSEVKDSRNTSIRAYVKLYTVWCLLSKAKSQVDLTAATALLDQYSKDPELDSVMPAVLLTLWYIDRTEARRERLVAAYPQSPEAAVVQGKAWLVPSPFWYFLPTRTQGGPATAIVQPEKPPVKAEPVPTEPASPPRTLQLGLFRNREYADKYAQQIKAAGFAPTISQQEKEDQVYFLITVPEADPETQKKLKAAGFDSVPIKP
ncbi:MAG: SPOR domain-containing protein [Spirochaetaceae bacterium]|jgi:hypothetical protein|nr:SPOR domain-containing protein [Spirochaetaceae bacterium]